MDIQRLQSLKILVMGDYCIDIFKYGSCNRISPEAPVPVFHYNNETKTDGMAGNVYNNIKAFNANVDLLISSKNIVKERYIDIKSKQHLLRVDYESKLPEINVDYNSLIEYDCIVISDYNKGSITNELVKSIINIYKKPIFIDSKKEDLTIFNTKNCILKINEQEFLKAKIFKNSNLIVTLGADGASFDGKLYPAKKVEVFDVSGAGDSFLSGLVIQYLITKNFDQAINFANICAANVVKKSGTAVINLEEIKNDICF